jgi:diguanylate cyclase (GGDEF)-like protein
MPQLPQPLLLLLLLAALGLAAYLGTALARARRRLQGGGERPVERRGTQPITTRGTQPVPVQAPPDAELRRWVTSEYLRFLRQIHGPIKTREIPVVLMQFIGSTFDPEAGVILIRRRPALSDPGRESQLVVASAPGTQVKCGGVIELGEGNLGYVAQARRTMDRHELDQTPSAGGDVGAVAGFQPQLAAPLVVGNKTLGVVGISEPRKSRERAKQLLDLIAQTAALALENNQVLHQIRTAASADPLTGVYNKGALLHQLDELLDEAGRTDGEVAIFLFDLDHFKNYNDNNGHLAGDELLRLLTSLISDEVRSDDVFGRFGGEEFLLILPGRSAGEAEMTAKKLLHLVRGHRFAGGGGQPLGKITVSGGVAVFPHHAEDRSGLLQAADRALYRAKERGRDQVLMARDPAEETDPGAKRRPVEVDTVDDLQQISGIGPVFEKALHEVGISTYRDIAGLNWTRMVLVASRLNTFPERIVSDRWLQQARQLHHRKYGEQI